jgi:hypothetical protein
LEGGQGWQGWQYYSTKKRLIRDLGNK